MVTIEDISVSFNATPVLRGISFALGEGELVGLVGPSGSGKSVLLKVLANVIPPDSGTISSGQPGARPSVGFLFQEGALFDSMSVIENVAFPLLTCGEESEQMSRSEAYDRAAEVLRRVGLAEAVLKHPGQLSGGMRRRAGIARALVARPEVVLLDDPTGGLDPVAASVIMNLILELHRDYEPTVVLVSHDIRRLMPSVQRLLALFRGQIVCDVPPDEVLSLAPPEVVQFLRTRYDFPEEGGLSV